MRSGLTFNPKLMSRRNKILFLLAVALTCLFVRLQRIPSSGSHRPANITILLWYWPFRTPYNLAGDICLEMYGIPGCHLVDNRSLYSTADIVVFHHHELKTRRQKLPLHLPRSDGQRWLWLSLEAPPNNGNLTPYAGIFNLTMSYRPDADITVPYGKLVRGEAEHDSFNVPQNKTHLVCWVVSNYKKQHKRTRVYQQLKSTIPVQVYGKATKRPLPHSALLTAVSRCYFYLAFENTESPHYITEKLWRNAFQAGTVPVVLGPPRRHYEMVAPAHSFIHVDDFESIDALGMFLKDLANDTKRYQSYLAWHQNNTVKLYFDWRERLCNICPVHDRLPHKIYHNLTSWARG
ncbi:alpha-(1,3)-fucosyltransferase 7 [Salminus brasiliensis]|uniref:alpha-(1,3)-fucosyltransferase 7 n=1 Tax=Salminus brasiliensis TaxID=930266 RepID=UPI003B82EC52